MIRSNFRLALEPGLEGVVRLAQLHQYATDLVDGKRVLIGPALRERITLTFPRRRPEAVLDALLGKGLPNWDIVGSDGGSEVLTIVTRPEGAALSAIVRIIEQVAPEAMRRPINYEPVTGGPLPPPSRLLH